ncbi:hypothetical protein K7432_013330, partial [Basidiobolus ranarum]
MGMDWFERAASQGHKDAFDALIRHKLIGSSADIVKKTIYENFISKFKISSNGSYEYYMGKKYIIEENYDDAENMFIKSLEKGYEKSREALDIIYFLKYEDDVDQLEEIFLNSEEKDDFVQKISTWYIWKNNINGLGEWLLKLEEEYGYITNPELFIFELFINNLNIDEAELYSKDLNLEYCEYGYNEKKTIRKDELINQLSELLTTRRNIYDKYMMYITEEKDLQDNPFDEE